jgi:metal-sulfur cluster biosynthetic enzyme
MTQLEVYDLPDQASLDDERYAEVMAALGDVLDPELDEPVTDMGFIESITLRAGDLDVVFRLPTFWCSANFAFLMATDMKAAVERLSWARQVTIRLVDHFAARKINQGVAARQQTLTSTTFVGSSAKRRFSVGRNVCCVCWPRDLASNRRCG